MIKFKIKVKKQKKNEKYREITWEAYSKMIKNREEELKRKRTRDIRKKKEKQKIAKNENEIKQLKE